MREEDSCPYRSSGAFAFGRCAGEWAKEMQGEKSDFQALKCRPERLSSFPCDALKARDNAVSDWCYLVPPAHCDSLRLFSR